MKRSALGICIILVVLLAALPLQAQNRGATGSGSDAGRGVATGATYSGSVSGYSTGSPSYSTYSGSVSYSADPIGNRAFGGTSYSSGNYASRPNLEGTSFFTYDYWSIWNNYYSYLYHYYSLNPSYFTRFYHNREPLMTPAMLRIALRQPLFISTEMLTMIDQLEMMLRDAKSGKAVDKEEIIAKSQAIRRMAKLIRGNRTLAIIDLRQETNAYKESDSDALSLESIGKLRELALDLNRQLREMYSMSSSSTISVQSYQDYSFESMAKGIEKACKEIENSSKRL
jgi:hypothetical protein